MTNQKARFRYLPEFKKFIASNIRNKMLYEIIGALQSDSLIIESVFEGFSIGTLWALLFLYKDIHYTKNISDTFTSLPQQVITSVSLAIIHSILKFIVHMENRLKKIMLDAEESIKKNIRQTSHIMKTLNIVGITIGVTLIALAGIAVASALLLTQTVNATSDAMNATNLSTDSSNNNSNVTLGNLFYIAQGVEETFNPVNETYFVISYVDSVTLMPPNATADTVINATERGNFTVTILPNGLSLNQGQGIITTEGDSQESATATFVSLGRTDAEGTTGSATGSVFFSTNSTGQLAFLNNIVGIAQVEFSPEGSTVRIWEWKSGTLAPILE